MMVGTVLLVFSAAFDVVDHWLFLTKLTAYGFSSKAINWMHSYLSSRMQSVFFNGSLSFPEHLKCGVPQGSCLGPLLFSMFTNDMPYVLDKCSATPFADYTTIYFASGNITKLRNTLQSKLQLLLDWICENRLILNVAKTKRFSGPNVPLVMMKGYACHSRALTLNRFKRQICWVSH